MSIMDVIMTSIDDPKAQTLNSSIPRKPFYHRQHHHHHHHHHHHQPNNNNNNKNPVVPSIKRSVCKYWIKGTCTCGDKCRFLHSWSQFGTGFKMLARLQGHKRPVVGIANPLSSDKLYTASRDGEVRVWNCYTGNCDRVTNVGAEIGSFICHESWVIIGLPNSVRAWQFSDSSTYREFILDGPVGQVYALAVFNDFLFAGSSNGDILVWRGSFEANPFTLIAILKGHNKAVLTLNVGTVTNTLYSGSVDKSVKVWDLESFQCKQTLKVHRDVVMSLLSYDRSLLTCSLDHTVKQWDVKEGGTLELAKNKEEKAGIIKVSGMHDGEGKAVVLISCNDNTTRIYELGTLVERDRIFAQEEVRDIQRGPYGLFFTGDATGVVTVWDWIPQTTTPQEQA